jgi:predicted small lipoprotein YifL
MIKKFLILIVTTLSLTSCGYGPIYSDKNTMDFEITSFKIEGDTEVNNIVQNKLGKYLDNNSEKKYIISIRTDYQKEVATKDATGKATNFKLIVNLTLNYTTSELENNRVERVINFSESQMIKRDQNNYEQTNYENILIRNMSELLINRVILQLVRG